MRDKITKRAVEALREGEWLWDSAVTGFGAKRGKGGVFYYLRYRIGGREQYMAIGKHGSPWTPDAARDKALELLGQIKSGTDPAAKRNAPAPETFGATMERYLAKRRTEMRPRSFEEVARHLQKHAKPLHRLPLAEIDRRTIAQRLSEIESASGPVARNRVRSSLSAFWAWAIREGLLEHNPVANTNAAIERTRDRVLTPAELSAIWHGLGDGQFADIVRLLILTGQRRDEIGGLKWSEITTAEGGLTRLGAAAIVLGPERTKNHLKHEVPLAPAAAAIIARQPRRDRAHVFGNAEGGFSGWSVSKAALDARLGLEQTWTLHDLRRTVATGMAGLGVLPHVIEAVLNHQSGHKRGPAGIYNRATYPAECRAALERWADWVTTGATSTVVPLRRA